MSNFKKNLVSNITLIVILTFTVVHLTIVTLSLFNVIQINLYEGFNYFVAYSFLILSLLLYILGFFIENITKLTIPAWFEVVFYIAFFLFTNVYYILNLYSNIFAIVFLFAYISFIVTVINISVFFETQKDDKNRIIATKNYIVKSIFYYSIGTNGILELIITLFKYFIFPDSSLTTIETLIIEFSSLTITTIIFTILLNLSLLKSKSLINACLIKKKVKEKANEK